MENLLNKIAQKLLQQDPDKYYVGETDYGYYNNGVGMACCGKESIYDECQAYEDAKEYLQEQLDMITERKEGYPDDEILEELLKVDDVYNFINNLIETA